MQGEKTTTDESVKKIEVPVPMPLMQVPTTNYRHWMMRMEVHLDAQGLWEVIAEMSGVQLDIKKSTKVN